MRISDWSSDVCSSDLILKVNTKPPPSESDSTDDKSLPPVASRNPSACSLRMSLKLNHGARRSEERRVGKELSVRVDLGGRRIIKKKNKTKYNRQDKN